MHKLLTASRGRSVPIWAVTADTITTATDNLSPFAGSQLAAIGFEPKVGSLAIVASQEGGLEAVLFGYDAQGDGFFAGQLPAALPAGTYSFANTPFDPTLATLAWVGGQYRFSRYKKADAKPVILEVPEGVDGAEVSRIADAITLTRDLINTPANDMGPAELEAVTRNMAALYGAEIDVIEGDGLLKANLPLIHAVGRASPRLPRLIDLSWGETSHPKVTLVGKGVCFDTGGLDIKPSSNMILMKKDMGGAATVLGLAQMIMGAGLKIRLRVLIPAVENSISGNAFRPSDIYPSRKGLSVEIGNTDAEGRLVLCDALALADEEAPELLIDMATLTGAARVALGPDMPPFYTHDDSLALDLAQAAYAQADPLWRMPLWAPYARMLDSKVADLSSTGNSPFAGSITAALYLSRFVAKAKVWAHFDLYGWVPTDKPGRPAGGEMQAARALYAVLRQKYA